MSSFVEQMLHSSIEGVEALRSRKAKETEAYLNTLRVSLGTTLDTPVEFAEGQGVPRVVKQNGAQKIIVYSEMDS